MNKPYTHYKTSWDDGADDHRQRMHTFGLWSTTATEVGQIGGVGYRLYFEVLGWIRYLFLLLAIANTPSLYLNLTCCGVDADGSAVDNMYDSRNITDLDRLSLVPLPDSLSQVRSPRPPPPLPHFPYQWPSVWDSSCPGKRRRGALDRPWALCAPTLTT